ncbi:hypothetical protein BT69DRAFT_1285532 [Atractiella rhizophila]|nr:hypothetical protein BT69DRAFT_1285532 [Atractiella rhizophila]
MEEPIGEAGVTEPVQKPVSKKKAPASAANKKRGKASKKSVEANTADAADGDAEGGRKTRASTSNATEASKANGSTKKKSTGKKNANGTGAGNGTAKGGKKAKKPTKATINKLLASKVEPVKVPEKYKLADGTLVWARMTGYPYFPAEVSDESEVPDHIQASKPEDVDIPLYPVQFFDLGTQGLRSWQWLPRDRLLLLGENKEIDEFLQTKEAFVDAGKYLEKVKWGYKWACNNMDEKTAFKK